MKIVGIDPSIRGTCIYEIDLSQNFDILDTYYLLWISQKTLPKTKYNLFYSGTSKDRKMEEIIDEVGGVIEAAFLRYTDDVFFALEAPVLYGQSVDISWQNLYGVIQHYIRKYKKNYIQVPAVTLKKFATGDGRADKELMGKYFFLETNIDLSFIPDKKNDPKSNIYDAYFLAKLGYLYQMKKTFPKKFNSLRLNKYIINKLNELIQE